MAKPRWACVRLGNLRVFACVECAVRDPQEIPMFTKAYPNVLRVYTPRNEARRVGASELILRRSSELRHVERCGRGRAVRRQVSCALP